MFSYRPTELKFPKGLLIPKRGLIYDHVFVRKTLGGMWCMWQSLVKPINMTETTKVPSLQPFYYFQSNSLFHLFYFCVSSDEDSHFHKQLSSLSFIVLNKYFDWLKMLEILILKVKINLMQPNRHTCRYEIITLYLCTYVYMELSLLQRFPAVMCLFMNNLFLCVASLQKN